MHRHLKNNTPVNTEVLWGGGLWWGLLRADRVPACNDLQDVIDACYAVVVDITLTDADGRVMQIQVIHVDITIAIKVARIRSSGGAGVVDAIDTEHMVPPGNLRHGSIAIAAHDHILKKDHPGVSAAKCRRTAIGKVGAVARVRTSHDANRA